MYKSVVHIVKIASIILLLVCHVVVAISQQPFHMTIGNNLLYDATLTPNLRLGFRLADHWSMGLTAGYRPWPTDDDTNTKWRHLLLSPDVRYWFDGVNTGHFVGGNLIYAHYNMSNVPSPFFRDDKNVRRQGDLGAVGAFYGYSWNLGRYWNIEAVIGAAVGYTKYGRYECEHCGRKLSTEKKVFAVPQAALNIVYNIPGRPKPAPVVEEPIILPPPPEEPFHPVLHPVPDFTGRAGQLQKDNPVLAHISQYKPYDRTRILRRDKAALYVRFPLAKSELRTDFRDNREVMERIVDITRQIMADTASSVKMLQIIGLASIEGPIAGNEQLATDRALALQHYIQQQLQIPDSLFKTVGGGEAWAEFRDQLEELVASQSPQAEELQQALDIIGQVDNMNECERRLKRMNKGRTWKYIKENILSNQRNSGYIRIYYDYVPDTAAATINEASELLTTDCSDCHHEALRLLLTVRHDERAQNALGLAYWLCGQQDEALNCFRRAAAQGNADAQENLRQLEKRTKQRENNSIN